MTEVEMAVKQTLRLAALRQHGSATGYRIAAEAKEELARAVGRQMESFSDVRITTEEERGAFETALYDAFAHAL